MELGIWKSKLDSCLVWCDFTLLIHYSLVVSFVCEQCSFPIGRSSVSLKHKINSERLREAQNKHYNVHLTWLTQPTTTPLPLHVLILLPLRFIWYDKQVWLFLHFDFSNYPRLFIITCFVYYQLKFLKADSLILLPFLILTLLPRWSFLWCQVEVKGF